MTTELDLLDRRMSHVEETLTDHTRSLATMQGTLDVIRDTLDSVNKSSGSSEWLKKALIGAIVVQSVLYGITTPEAAKTAVAALFSGGIH